MTVAAPFTLPQVAAFLAFADSVLAAPPAKPWIERHPGRGRIVLRFALPLGMVRGANEEVRHRAGWALAKDRSNLLSCISAQLVWQLKSADGLRLVRNGRGVIWAFVQPLMGRPMLRCVRFSSRPVDDTAAWWKTVGDVLLPAEPARVVTSKKTGRQRPVAAVPGLGVLRADGPDALVTRAWYEPAPRGQGGALVEVWTGEP